MTFKKEYAGNVGFREKLSFQDQIQIQMKVCLEVFTEGNPMLIRFAVDAFTLLITPDIQDDIYDNDILKLEATWKKEYTIKLKEYNKLLSRSRCPDVIDKPSDKEPLDYIKVRYALVQALFERKKLLLEKQREETL